MKIHCLFVLLASLLLQNHTYSQKVDHAQYDCDYVAILDQYESRDSAQMIVDPVALLDIIYITSIDAPDRMREYCQRVYDTEGVADSIFYKALYYDIAKGASFSSWDSLLEDIAGRYSEEHLYYHLFEVARETANFLFANPPCDRIDRFLSFADEVRSSEFYTFYVSSILQMSSVCAAHRGNDSLAILYERERANLLDKHSAPCAPIKGRALISIGRRFQSAGELDSALHYFKTANTFFAEYGSGASNVEDQLSASLNIASAMTKMGKALEAIEVLERAKRMGAATDDSTVDQKMNKDISSYMSIVYNRLGQAYQQLANKNLATQNYQKAIGALRGDKPTIQKLGLYANIGDAMNDLGQPTLGRDYLEQARTMANALVGPDHIYSAIIKANLGKSSLLLDEYEASHRWYHESLSIRKKIYGEEHSSIASQHVLLAELYQKQSKPIEALRSFDRAIAIYAKKGDNRLEAAHAYLGKSKLLSSEGRYNDALESIDLGMDALSVDRDAGLYVDLAKRLEFEIERAINQYHRSEGQNTVKILPHFATAASTYQYLMRHTPMLSDKAEIAELAHRLFRYQAAALLDAYEESNDMDYLRQSLEICDLSKSQALYRGLKEHAAIIQSDIPDEITDRHRRLEATRAKVMSMLTDPNTTEESREEWRDSLLTIDDEQEAIMAAMHEASGISKVATTGDHPATIEQLQDALHDGQVAVNLMVMGDQIIAYSLYKNKVDYKVIAGGSRLLNELAGASHVPNIDSLVALSPLFEFDAGVSSIIIIPDGRLSGLPFEVIPLGEEMLLNRYSISYASSIGILGLQKSSDRPSRSKHFAGFAPEYATSSTETSLAVRDGLWALPFAEKEVVTIANLLAGDAFLGSVADKDRLKEELQRSDVVHLSMHAVVDEEHPMNSRFLFSASEDAQKDLYLYELSHLATKVKLITLSACETGVGQYHNGAGARSLANGFLYAGIPSAVMSLWKVPDESTSEIMISFYQYLKDGYRKDAALQMAKKDYLQNAVSNLQKDPFYWAGLVLIGDDSPISFEDDSTLTWGLGILLCGLAMIYIFVRRRSARSV